eukprot:1156152-Pelagomonas_calceolata.AAC.1
MGISLSQGPGHKREITLLGSGSGSLFFSKPFFLCQQQTDGFYYAIGPISGLISALIRILRGDKNANSFPIRQLAH